MAVQAGPAGPAAAAGESWYRRSPDEVAAALHVDPEHGLTDARAAQLLAANGPNALPEEKPKPGWLRFISQYRSYMQIILVAAAVVSLAIKEWSTGVLLLLLTVLNAVVGLRVPDCACQAVMHQRHGRCGPCSSRRGQCLPDVGSLQLPQLGLADRGELGP